MNFFKKLFGEKPNSQTPPDRRIVSQISLEEKFAQTIKVLEKHKRTAYLPIVQENHNSFTIKSKIGGFPYLRHDKDWPICPNCKKNMQLFLQLNLNELPERKDIAEEIRRNFWRIHHFFRL